MSQDMTGADVQAMLMNPFYTITLDPDLFGEHEPTVSRDEWITANVKLIDQLGPEQYLDTLLTILAGNFPRNNPSS